MLNFTRRLAFGRRKDASISYERSLIALENNAVKGDLFGYGTIPYGYYGGGVAGRSGELTYDKYGAAMAYMTVPVVNRSVNLIANAFDALPCRVIRNATNDPANDEVIATSTDNRPEHPLMKALHIAHNESKQSLFWLSAFSMLMYGDNFIEPLWGKESRAFVGLKWLNPVAVSVVVAGGRVQYYQYTYPAGGGSVIFKPEEIVHDHDRNPLDDFQGLSKVVVAMNKVNLLRDMDRFLGDYFRNNAVPDMVVSPKGENNFSTVDIERLRDQIRNNLKGSGNQHRVTISPTAADWLTLDQTDLDKQYTVNDPITRAVYTTFGIPLSMAGDDAGTQYKAGDPIRIAFYQNAIIPFAKDLQKFFNYEIMPLFDPLGVERLEFDFSEFDTVSEDDQIRQQVASGNVGAGLWSINEGRQYTGQEPDDALKDAYMIGGTPVPQNELLNQWKYRQIIAPSVYNSEVITGEPLPQPADPNQVVPTDTGAEPLAAESTPVDEPQATIDTELKTWRKHAINRGARKSAGSFDSKAIPSHIEAYICHELIDLGTDASKAQINALFDAVGLLKARAEIKAFEDTRAQYVRDLVRIIGAAQADETTRRKFAGEMRSVNRRYGLQAFRDGMESEGYSPESFSAQELDTFRNWQNETSGYITNFGTEVFKVGITETEVTYRADLWAGKSLRDIYLRGKVLAAPNKKKRWQRNPAKESCVDCIALDGVIRTLKEWSETIMPGSSALECWGGECGCSLEDVD